MPLRPCLQVGCRRLVKSGRCRAHAAARRRGARGVYSDPRWSLARARAIRRAGGRCEAHDAGVRCAARAGLHGHHAYEGGVEQMLRDGADPFDERWIAVLCAVHHGRLEAWLRARARPDRSIRR